MGENSKDMDSTYIPKRVSDILTKLSLIHDYSKKSSELDFFLHSFEEEMRKVDAFKRELPHCMHMLKDAIERLQKERLPWKEKGKGQKSDSEGDERAKMSIDINEKRNWMSSAQLWTTPVQYENNFDNQDSRYQEEESSGFGCNFRSRGGAFVPFKKPSGVTIKEGKRAVSVDGLSLSPVPVAEVESIDLNVKNESRVFVRPQPQQPHQQQQQRKQRRCWSPELHKLFVDALQILGGAQTATPKQIRELMKVEGLTNDEVKSHLQKYRLHIRKLPSSSLSWYQQAQCGSVSNPTVASSSSPQDHNMHLRGSAKRVSEENEDDKSESHSWKFQKHRDDNFDPPWPNSFGLPCSVTCGRADRTFRPFDIHDNLVLKLLEK
ncbi:hypothetical protein DH2020_037319 [Rehmannia glutinosa]|uniref:HTH myb-type domain-containing protein n=1 Tax=Rehmannia glutinosa TaxID=99300 RepID=A0ABR0V1Y1_REHGL